VVAGLRVLFWAIVLMTFFIYGMGIFMQRTVGSKAGQGNEHFDNFRSLPWSMFTLFRCFTDGCSAIDGTPLQVHLAEEFGVKFMLIYVFMFIFVTIGILNLILGMFVDNVFSASRRQSQKSRGNNSEEMKYLLTEALYDMSLRCETAVPQHNRKSKFSDTYQGVRRISDFFFQPSSVWQQRARLKSSRMASTVTKLDAGHKISRKLFTMWLHDKSFVSLLESMDINTANKGDLFDVLDRDLTGDLYFRDIIDGLMRMRGPPTKSDSVAALLGVRYLTVAVEDLRAKFEKVFVQGSSATAQKISTV